MVAQGVRLKIRAGFAEQWAAGQLWNGRELLGDLQAEVLREWDRSQLVARQVRELEALQHQPVARAQNGAVAVVQQRRQLRGWAGRARGG